MQNQQDINQDYDLTPEQRTRRDIDKRLRECGWEIQNYRDFNPGTGLGIAVREYPTDTGPVDYALFVDRKAVGVIEAKKDGEVLSNHEEQTEDYAKSKFKWQINEAPLPFVYEATSKEVRFTDLRDPRPRFRELFAFHQPETLHEWSSQSKSLRARFQDLPSLDETGLRDCQVIAINNLETSLKDNRPRALVQMATGSGKTFTAVTSIYRLLKFAKAKRVLFLVDTTNLGVQAEQELQAYVPQDDKNIFTNIYSVQRLNSSYIDPDAQVCISTIQRMYSILKGTELDEQNEEIVSEQNILPTDGSSTISYNPKVPIEEFDLIIIDECHRSIYNLWKQVLDYFDTFLVGLTATPDARTFGFFNKNVVSEYGYEEAVADGVNVPYDVYKIETEITSKGSQIKAGEFVDKRSRMTREKRWEQLDEELEYSSNDLDKKVVSEDQIRTVLSTFRDKLKTELFPERGDEVPKTLIFAKTDSHADDIIRIAREVFNEGNDFIRKVTYSENSASQFLRDFRTDFYPRIAVTVDMIATGTDVKPIECLIFMRNIKSRNYFEQMIGRGTRTLGKDDLKRVTPKATNNKTHFVIVDAVGVFETAKSDSRPLERKKSTPFKDLMLQTVMGDHSEDNLSSLANRLTRLDKELNTSEQQRISDQNSGSSLKDVVKKLFEALNPDKYIEKAKAMFGKSEEDITPDEIEQAKQELVKQAVRPFDNPNLRETILKIREEHDQIIDSVNIDTVTAVGYDPNSKERALADIKRFKDFLEENKDKIDALQIFYNQPYHRRALTFEMVKDLVEKLKYPPYSLNTDRVWRAYEIAEQDKVKGNAQALTDAVSLVRHGIGLDDLLIPFADIVEERYQNWLKRLEVEGKTFTPEQKAWLDMMKSHIAQSLSIEKDSFDHTPFAEHGGLFGAHKAFDSQLDELLLTLNRELVEA